MKIIDGEHRVRAYIDLDVDSIPCVILDLTKTEAKIQRQIQNKLHGTHDAELDLKDYIIIENEGLLKEFADSLGQPEDDFLKLLSKGDIEEEPTPEPPKEPTSKLGEIYQLGNHRIMCGDSTNQESIKQLLGNHRINLIITDPPYGVKYEQGKFIGIKVKKKFEPITNDEKQGDELKKFIESVFTLLEKFCDKTPIYMCSPSMMESLAILQALINVGFHMQSQIIWYKNQFILGRVDYHWQHELIWYGYIGKNHYWCGDRTQSTVWEISKDPHNSYQHPTQKPVELFKKAIRNSSKSNDIVVDTFLGSGSTLIACEQTNRVCYGMELDPGYIDVIIQRWEKFKPIAWHLPRPSRTKYKGSVPLHFETKLLRQLEITEDGLLQMFSGGSKVGHTVDINPDNNPDTVADCHDLPFPDNHFDNVYLDPPYSDEESKEIYGTGKLKPQTYINEAVRVCKPGGLICAYHVYWTPRPKGTKYLGIISIITRVYHKPRVCTIFQKDLVTERSKTQ